MPLSGLTFVTVGGAVPGLVIGSVLLGTGHLGCVVGQQALVANSTPTGGYDSAFGRTGQVAVPKHCRTARSRQPRTTRSRHHLTTGVPPWPT
jgi:hypothetical protein